MGLKMQIKEEKDYTEWFLSISIKQQAAAK